MSLGTPELLVILVILIIIVVIPLIVIVAVLSNRQSDSPTSERRPRE